MTYLIKIGSRVFPIISVLFVLGYLFGALNLHFSDRNDYCVMTYMFEYPQYVRITVPEDEKYPEYYSLYAYSEGRYTEKARKMWFDGVPVLFLPGNSGSYMQARSLASVALRMAISRYYEQHFDFYTIDYNEELSGIYGGVLEYQTDFASACIAKILNLYSKNKYTKSIPTSVILIGHSMGGVIVQRLMAHPSTVNSTTIAITLASPLPVPVLNTDEAMNAYYKQMEYEWEMNINKYEVVKNKKMMLSFGNGARDVLMPSGLTLSKNSYINAITTAVPGVWVSPDHVSIVWCKQIVMAITRFLFAIVDPKTDQISGDTLVWKSKAKQYFQANRSMFLDPDIRRFDMPMVADAFWYEDSRRIYQISRPEINRMTYLMIRLVRFPQNRFVAIEAVNVDDNDWIFGCSAMYTYGTHRYCKQATVITELSRWTGAADSFGKRKLATIHLHSIKDMHPDWSHVIVKVSPTRKPIILNVDINDHASREINVNTPSVFSYGKTVVIQETAPESLYYELLLPGFNTVHQAYLLYVEPTAGCKVNQYHVSAELHVPWAKNQEYSHYFTHLKQTPMKLRLFTSNPNVTLGEMSTENVKITLLLDPQCTFTVSISHSWYQRLAQIARNYTTVLVPYVVAVILLAARRSILNMKNKGSFSSVHSALLNDGAMPFYVLVFSRITLITFVSVPLLSYLFTSVSSENNELQYFIRSLLVLPAYMTAVGIVNIAAAAIIIVMVFSSQLAHRLLFRIIWRGGPSFAESVASGLQKIPTIVSVSLVCIGQYFCDSIALFAGAAFYAFLISKMYEEYLEDYVYKLMAKIASKMCYAFKSKKTNNKDELQVSLVTPGSSTEVLSAEKEDVNGIEKKDTIQEKEGKIVTDVEKENVDNNAVVIKSDVNEKEDLNKDKKYNKRKYKRKFSNDIDEGDELSTLNYHVLMFLLWICVALINVPPLLTWARNYTYMTALKRDTSNPVGLIMSVCSICLWQMKAPRKNLRYYNVVANLLLLTAVIVLSVGPLALFVVKYGLAIMFSIICLQQVYDKEESTSEITSVDDSTVDKTETSKDNDSLNKEDSHKNKADSDTNKADSDNNKANSDNSKENNQSTEDNSANSESQTYNDSETNESPTPSDCDVCNENTIYSVFKNFKEKFGHAQDT